MKFKFIGEEPSEFMGFRWFPGTEHDVTDAHAIKKLSNSVLFEKLDDAPAEDKPEPKKRTRNAAQPVSENGDDKNAE
jgi:hypothetical protein